MRQKVFFIAVGVFSNLVTALIVITLRSSHVPAELCPSRALAETRLAYAALTCATTNVTSPPCKCEQTVPTPRSHDPDHTAPPTETENGTSVPTIFMITPTYLRLTQKSDLTSVCVTLMHVPDLVWIIVEDSELKTELVANLLKRCKVKSVHLNAVTPKYYRDNIWKPRGVLQRNAGLNWIREHHTVENCSGIVYFGDDDNSYDLRVFEKMRETKQVSVWPVAFSGGVKVEGPICKDGVVDTWHHGWGANRPFPIDMAGFAVHLCLLMQHPKVLVGRDRTSRLSKPGYLESNLLEQLVNKDSLECRGPPSEIIVWHVKTERPDISREDKNPSDPSIEL